MLFRLMIDGTNCFLDFPFGLILQKSKTVVCYKLNLAIILEFGCVLYPTSFWYITYLWFGPFLFGWLLNLPNADMHARVCSGWHVALYIWTQLQIAGPWEEFGWLYSVLISLHASCIWRSLFQYVCLYGPINKTCTTPSRLSKSMLRHYNLARMCE